MGKNYDGRLITRYLLLKELYWLNRRHILFAIFFHEWNDFVLISAASLIMKLIHWEELVLLAKRFGLFLYKDSSLEKVWLAYITVYCCNWKALPCLYKSYHTFFLLFLCLFRAWPTLCKGNDHVCSLSCRCVPFPHTDNAMSVFVINVLSGCCLSLFSLNVFFSFSPLPDLQQPNWRVAMPGVSSHCLCNSWFFNPRYT